MRYEARLQNVYCECVGLVNVSGLYEANVMR
jgi:hypothetical protein